MSETRRKHTREFKLAAVRRIQSGYSVARLARELEVNANQLHLWKQQFEAHPNSAFSGAGNKRREETQVAELERKIGQQAMEIDFLKNCLRHIEELQKPQVEIVNLRSAGRSGKNTKGAPR